MSIQSYIDAVSFRFNGKYLGGNFKQAEDLAIALIASKVTSLFFTNVSASRSRVTGTGSDVQHEHRHWVDDGPFHPQDFLNMMQYERDISNANWSKHMNEKARITVLEPSEGKT
jgi:hypothetical protein